MQGTYAAMVASASFTTIVATNRPIGLQGRQPLKGGSLRASHGGMKKVSEFICCKEPEAPLEAMDASEGDQEYRERSQFEQWTDDVHSTFKDLGATMAPIVGKPVEMTKCVRGPPVRASGRSVPRACLLVGPSSAKPKAAP